MESHGLFINYEADDLESIHGPICRAQGTHCRGEDWPFETQGNFISAPIWHQYGAPPRVPVRLGAVGQGGQERVGVVGPPVWTKKG